MQVLCIAGVYTSWNDCEAQVTGSSGAIYKSFKTEKEARAYLDEHGVCTPAKKRIKPTKQPNLDLPAPATKPDIDPDLMYRMVKAAPLSILEYSFRYLPTQLTGYKASCTTPMQVPVLRVFSMGHNSLVASKSGIDNSRLTLIGYGVRCVASIGV